MQAKVIALIAALALVLGAVVVASVVSAQQVVEEETDKEAIVGPLFVEDAE
jgi:hypothetical protein